MTLFEILRTSAIPVFPVLHGRAHGDLRRLIRSIDAAKPLSMLDVGGRSSPYSTGLNARITLMDLPRESEVQEHLKLGFNERILEQVQRRRSNIDRVLIEDMCKTTLPDAGFDIAAAVEVLEHVPDDRAFLHQMARVLKPGGWAYLTTPNGEWVKHDPENNPDHLRHYTREWLAGLLEECFDEVHVVYGIKTGKHRWRGLRSFDFKSPGQLAVTMGSNLINHWESRNLDEVPQRTANLIAWARKNS